MRERVESRVDWSPQLIMKDVLAAVPRLSSRSRVAIAEWYHCECSPSDLMSAVN